MNSNTQTSKFGIPGSTLKIIAITVMFIDHFAAIILANYMISGKWATGPFTYQTLYNIYMAMRVIGRLGFPIFCFLLVEGFMHTHNVWKYLRNLAIFALISEIPFNLAFGDALFTFEYQNVFFTLLFGLLGLIGISYAMRRESWHIVFRILSYPAYFLTGLVTVFYVSKWLSAYDTQTAALLSDVNTYLLGGVVAEIMILFSIRKMSFNEKASVGYSLYSAMFAVIVAELMHTDYSGSGVLVILAMYYFRYSKPIFRGFVGCLILTLMQAIEASAFFILIPLGFYNGKRGISLKYFFYAFYPAHILILYFISVLMGTVNL